MATTVVRAHESRTGIYDGKLGMWIFLASEIMFFSGFFTAFYVLYRANPEVFHESASHLQVGIAFINTLVLIGSSLTMALAIANIERNNVKKFQLFMGLTFLGGVIFLINKVIEYGGKFAHGIFPSTNVFYAMYFTMTGFHGLHVLAGMIPIAWMFLRSFTRQGYHNAARVEVLGLYWHFVDLVWIFLFPVFYLILNPDIHWF